MLPQSHRKRGPPTALRIHTPALDATDISPSQPADSASASTSSAATMSPCTSDSDFPFHPNKPRSLRNMKKLSLTLPSATSSSNSLSLPPSEPPQPSKNPLLHDPEPLMMKRRPSVISLPNPPSINPLLHRKEEDGDGSPTVPYSDGPIQIIPGIWLGAEDNARDWPGLTERGIKAVLNVAKEVASPFDTAVPQSAMRRAFQSTPDLKQAAKESEGTYYPAHRASGRPGMHYLKMHWSHGQQDLVEEGFPSAMAFVDAALAREEGILIHCQCGISRSATLVIALVMRAAAQASPAVPPEVWALKGMQGAYAYVKEQSKWVGPNMSLIYQLMDYERKLKGASSPTPSEQSSATADSEAEWGRRRAALDEQPSEPEDDHDQEHAEHAREARALDKAMEDRVRARTASSASTSSLASTSSSVGMGPAWRSRYRASSIASNKTGGTGSSVLSEDLVEVDEEADLLGVGGGFDGSRSPSVEPDELSSADSHGPKGRLPFAPLTTARGHGVSRPPPSAPVFRTSFGAGASMQPPASAMKSSFDLPPIPASAARHKLRGQAFNVVPPSASPTTTSFGAPVPPSGRSKRRPPPLSKLPPVPSSPVAAVPVQPPPRARKESRKPAPPPLHLKDANAIKPGSKTARPALAQSQTLFVFPPSPDLKARTPSTMTLLSTSAVPFPTSAATPRVASTPRPSGRGRPRSFIKLGVPPTPTTACSRVDAKGWFGQ